jgi:anaerobic selenocysteine-containing dehydrogenase
VDGRAVKIEGNPASANNQGTICPKGQAGLQFLYDPDRIKGPMRLRGARGSGDYEQISWDQAIKEVAARLKEIREGDGPHTLALLSGRNRGSAHHIHGYWRSVYGSPNDVGHGSICEDASPNAHMLTQGYWHYVGYDWDNTNYAMIFGGSMLEAWRPTARMLNVYGDMRQGRPTRGKIVAVETRLSITAAKADEWIPIKRGTDAALALGMAHVIIDEGLFDEDFVEEHTFGFDEWTDESGVAHMGFKDLVLRDYSPQKASDICGVPASTIRRLAREFGTSGPSLATGARGNSMQTNGTYNRMAVHSLTALCGGIDRPGGILSQKNPPLKSLHEFEVMDEIAERGNAQPRIDHAGTRRFPIAPGKVYQEIPDSILNEDPYKLNAVLLYYTDPLSSLPESGKAREAFMKVPFIVSFSPFWSEGTSISDYILPDDTYLERWHDDVIYPSLGFEHYAVRQPVVEKVFDTRSSFTVFIQLAKEIGGSMAASFSRFETGKEIIQYRTEGIQEAGFGSITADTHAKWWEKFLEVGIWQNPPYEFGDWERVFKGNFGTPSGRFEFYSQNMVNFLTGVTDGTEADLNALLDELKIAARGDEVFMPHHETPREHGDPNEYPLQLIHYKTMPHAEGRGANVPWLQEIFGHHVGTRWSTWVEINPDTAQSMGIANGDEVWVESIVGKLQLPAVLFAGTQPGMVNIPFEPKNGSAGRWAGVHNNVNEIVVHDNDIMSGTEAWHTTRVKVYKA